MNETTFTTIQVGTLTDNDITRLIMREKGPKGTIGAHITPSEIDWEIVDAIGLLHDSVFDGNLLACRKNLVDHDGSSTAENVLTI